MTRTSLAPGPLLTAPPQPVLLPSRPPALTCPSSPGRCQPQNSYLETSPAPHDLDDVQRGCRTSGVDCLTFGGFRDALPGGPSLTTCPLQSFPLFFFLPPPASLPSLPPHFLLPLPVLRAPLLPADWHLVPPRVRRPQSAACIISRSFLITPASGEDSGDSKSCLEG